MTVVVAYVVVSGTVSAAVLGTALHLWWRDRA